MSLLLDRPIKLRPARRRDAFDIARLYRISSDGVADYIWSRLATAGEDVLDVGVRRYARSGTAFSYENCTIAESRGRTVGMMVAFPTRVDRTSKGGCDPVLAPYAKLEEDHSYYICGVALFPNFRNRGIGGRFLTQAEGEARALGLPKASLIVFEENQAALRLYDRLGYREAAREPVVPHPLINYGGDALLMVKELN